MANPDVKQFEPYEDGGKWWYYAIAYENNENFSGSATGERVTFGPFDTQDAAEIDSTQAEACWS